MAVYMDFAISSQNSDLVWSQTYIPLSICN